MIILQIIGVIIVVILASAFFMILRAFVIYSMVKDLPEKEQDEMIKEIEKNEANYLITHHRDL